MMNSRSAPDTSELRDMYEFIRSEVLELNARWIVFKQLFANGDARITLFNREVPAFFSMVHDSMRDSIFMSIARLTENAKRDPKKTLSLRQLIARSRLLCNDAVSPSIQDRLDKIEEESRAIKAWRDKSGAHNDMRTSLNPQVHALPPIMFDSIGFVLRETADLLNAVGALRGEPPTDFESIIMFGDGETIISCLESAKEHRMSGLRKPLA